MHEEEVNVILLVVVVLVQVEYLEAVWLPGIQARSFPHGWDRSVMLSCAYVTPCNTGWFSVK